MKSSIIAPIFGIDFSFKTHWNERIRTIKRFFLAFG